GTMTGSAGGVLRDMLTAQVPHLLRGGFYASAAIAGIVLYLLLQAMGLPRRLAFYGGLVAVASLRLGAIYQGWHLPTLQLPG
ncbi:MAG TPA: TRIC cation channel family protein, partial [Burkholderiaceae bacterium]